MRLPFDEYEKVKLVETYMELQRHPSNEWPPYMEQLSSTLRRYAQFRGLAIDDKYRSVASLTIPLFYCDYFFTNGKRGLPGGSQWMRRLLNLYRMNPDSFNDLLQKANHRMGLDYDTEKVETDHDRESSLPDETDNAAHSIYSPYENIAPDEVWDKPMTAKLVEEYHKLHELPDNEWDTCAKILLDKLHAYVERYRPELLNRLDLSEIGMKISAINMVVLKRGKVRQDFSMMEYQMCRMREVQRNRFQSYLNSFEAYYAVAVGEQENNQNASVATTSDVQCQEDLSDLPKHNDGVKESADNPIEPKNDSNQNIAARVPFTQHEAALLLFYLLQVISGDMRRKDAIVQCSEELRRMASKEGMIIDTAYRSEIGIRQQMVAMESAYYSNTKGYPSELFKEIVSLFRQNPDQFQKIVDEARGLTQGIKSLSQEEPVSDNMSIESECNDTPKNEPIAYVNDRQTKQAFVISVKDNEAEKNIEVNERIKTLVCDAGLSGITVAKISASVHRTVVDINQYVKENPLLVEINGRLIHRDSFVDYAEGAAGLERILAKLMDKNDGYVSAVQLYEYARAELTLFLDDNDLDDQRKVYDFAEHLFAKEFFDGVEYNFRRKQHISPKDGMVGDRMDLLKNFAAHCDGLIRKEEVDEYFSGLGMTPPSLYEELSTESRVPLVFYKSGIFLTVKSIGIDDDWLENVRNALGKLFSDTGNHVVLRSIQQEWYALLPSLPNNLSWSAIFLQNVLMQYGKNLNAHIIRALPNQWLDTLAAMVVTADGQVQTFSEGILAMLVDNRIEKREFDLEDLRKQLVDWGMIGSGELQGNGLCKATESDRRFLWDRNKRHVTIRF